MNRNNIMIFFKFLDMSLPPGGQIQKWCTLIDFIICHKFAIHCACKLWTRMMTFRFFPILWHIDAPWWPNTQINITEMIVSWFATKLQFIVYVALNYQQERYDFFQFLGMSLPPGGQIQKSIWLKCCTLIDFMICHKFAIQCARKVWTGTMIFRLFQFLDILMPPGGQIHKSI